MKHSEVHERSWWDTARLLARLTLALSLSLVIGCAVAVAQKKRTASPPSTTSQANDTVSKLRDDYIKATKDYKAISERLLVIQERNASKAQDRLTQSKRLFEEGLISKRDVEESQRAFDEAQARVEEVRRQIAKADTEIAETLIEIQTEKQMAKVRIPRGGFVRTTSFIRFNGAATWLLSSVGTIENFFLQKFHKPLPIAVFGQGEIHQRWRLDHRNAMDISLHPDSAEGQALMEFLHNNGIPFSAFRSVIPGTATGPHIHIGRPSHRY